MRKTIIGVLAMTLTTMLAAADDGIPERLETVVRVEGGKMIMEDFMDCLLDQERLGRAGEPPLKRVVRTYAEAPESGVVSRDFFVQTATSNQTLLVLVPMVLAGRGAGPDAVEALTCRDLDPPVERVDIELKLFMSADGLQFEYRDNVNQKQASFQQPWDE